jgi:hypothetical protein
VDDSEVGGKYSDEPINQVSVPTICRLSSVCTSFSDQSAAACGCGGMIYPREAEAARAAINTNLFILKLDTRTLYVGTNVMLGKREIPSLATLPYKHGVASTSVGYTRPGNHHRLGAIVCNNAVGKLQGGLCRL